MWVVGVLPFLPGNSRERGDVGEVESGSEGEEAFGGAPQGIFFAAGGLSASALRVAETYLLYTRFVLLVC